MNESQIVERLEELNNKYRSGNPELNDSEYDSLLKMLPDDHCYKQKIEEEKLGKDLFTHKVKMLSTQKAKTNEEVMKWINKVYKSCYESKIDTREIYIRVTAKLDGMAAKLYDDGALVTRGNGIKGNVVTSAFEKGVVNVRNSKGVGELVIEKDYFDKFLSNSVVDNGFSHPRNAVVGVVMCDEVNENIKCALEDRAIHFATYNDIHNITCHITEFTENYRSIEEEVRNNTPYPIDGVVIEVIHEELKEFMGSTEHHYNWMIALKPKDEVFSTRVEKIIWQTGRTGKVTPVLKVEPTEIDGAIISNVTGHNYSVIIDNEIGTGSIIAISRSGGVIPKFEKTLISSKNTEIPRYCSSCNNDLKAIGADLYCNNDWCDAKIEATLLHFFNTIENIDGFGPAVIHELVINGYTSLKDIYKISKHEFESIGFGEKTSENLFNELVRSMTTEIEDWRFLAAFGISGLGKGTSKKILSEYNINDIFNLSFYSLLEIEGIGTITSEKIIDGLFDKETEILSLLDFFNLKNTKSDKKVESNITGKIIVFTGKMSSNRKEMEKEAETLGAKVGSGVTSKTDILVVGENVGKNKISKAEKFGTMILSEQEYNKFIK